MFVFRHVIEFLDKDDATQDSPHQLVDDVEMVSEDEGIVADLSSGTLFYQNNGFVKINLKILWTKKFS